MWRSTSSSTRLRKQSSWRPPGHWCWAASKRALLTPWIRAPRSHRGFPVTNDGRLRSLSTPSCNWHTLHLETKAEGVEQIEQRDVLATLAARTFTAFSSRPLRLHPDPRTPRTRWRPSRVESHHPGGCQQARLDRRSAFELERLPLRGCHLCSESLERPGPDGRDAAVVQIPAPTSRGPDGSLGRFDPRLFEIFHGDPGGTDLLTVARSDAIDQAHDVAQLELGYLHQRKVADRPVGSVQHEEVGVPGNRDREVCLGALSPIVGEVVAFPTDDGHGSNEGVHFE